MNGFDKIGILAEAAKYDASCSTSGSERDNTSGGIGNTSAAGICHAWSDDGRCVALLKVLLSNACIYDCAYCPNRKSNDIARAAFEPEELIRIAMDFYRRNYIEGLFLSSGIIRNPDYTMEQLVYIAKTLRTREHYNGYIHMKAIPGCAEALVLEAARWVDRLSVNLELPSSCSLALLAPDKKPSAIFSPMRAIARASGFKPDARLCLGQTQPTGLLPSSGKQALTVPASTGLAVSEAPRRYPSVMEARRSRKRDPRSATLPAGQTTQMIVGASPESDLEILMLSERLYLAYDVRRVYYSAYIPINQDSRLPTIERPPLLREHRLYQADWLFRYYGFTASEILSPSAPFLSDTLDPKCAWALQHPERFPVDVETAPYEELLRIPGIGPTSAKKILRARREARLDPDRLGTLGVVMKRAKYFLEAGGKRPSALVMRDKSWDGLRFLLADPMTTRFLSEGNSMLATSTATTASGYPEFTFEWDT